MRERWANARGASSTWARPRFRGLAAKPIVDILLEVSDSSDEAAYAPALESAGYVLRIREPGWYEHRLFKRPGVEINLHVFSRGCSEITRMLALRERLRTNAEDRELYERTKRKLAQRQWKYVQDYADAKSEVVEAILARVLGAVSREAHETPDGC